MTTVCKAFRQLSRPRASLLGPAKTSRRAQPCYHSRVSGSPTHRGLLPVGGGKLSIFAMESPTEMSNEQL